MIQQSSVISMLAVNCSYTAFASREWLVLKESFDRRNNVKYCSVLFLQPFQVVSGMSRRSVLKWCLQPESSYVMGS
jgi:hypothetical protein